jgi:hypothetical protein
VGLPVELTRFDAVADGSIIQLVWSTATETGNAGFDIEISADNQTFVQKGFVQGAGTTTEAQEYRFELDALTPGTNYVRLKQVDLDGGYEYSEVLEIDTEIPDGFVLRPAYPNPFNPSTTIEFVVAREMTVEMAVYDVMGQQVAVLFDGVAPASEVQQVVFEAGDLPSGTYVYRLSTPLGSTTRLLTLAK